MRGLLARLAAAVLVAAAALVVPVPLAQAAACGDGSGVTVVVDYASLGGGVGQSCAGTGTARQQFEAARYALTDVQSQPGLVCRVAGAPADVSCQDSPPAGAYWALWTSDGKSGRWSYASRGVDTLRVPAGGTVAFVWDDVAGDRTPSVSPAVHATVPTAVPTTSAPSTQPTKKPTKQPTKQPTRKPTEQPTEQPSTQTTAQPAEPPASPPSTAPTTAAPSTSASPTSPSQPAESAPGKASGTKVSELPSSPASTAPSATDEPVVSPAAQQSEQEDGVPTWLVLTLLGLVLVAAGAVAVRRRRTSRTP